jgi:ATP-binding cassette, subfamily B (MDR/TAP), member 1
MITVNAIGNIAMPIIQIFKASSAAAQFFKVIDAPRLTTGGLKAPEVSPQEDLIFKEVAFAYPGRPTVAVLKGLDLRFESGKTTAIVGPSGCGKSTIVALLERWYHISEKNVKIEKPPPKDKYGKKIKSKKSSKKDAKDAKDAKDGKSTPSESDAEPEGPILQNEGTVSLGQTNIEDLDARWWRSQIGLVQQEPFLFDDTILNNIAYGLLGSKWENEEESVQRAMVIEACKEAFADEFISRLPQVCKSSSEKRRWLTAE